MWGLDEKKLGCLCFGLDSEGQLKRLVIDDFTKHWKEVGTILWGLGNLALSCLSNGHLQCLIYLNSFEERKVNAYYSWAMKLERIILTNHFLYKI
jgi:quinol-cytochrome oxidoreductase complex cytochrome b subunit